MTEKHCTEPEGIMNEDTAYLQLLVSAAMYEGLADPMALSNGNGERVLIFAASAGGE